jgi:hypothetical protein
MGCGAHTCAMNERVQSWRGDRTALRVLLYIHGGGHQRLGALVET